MEIDKDKIDDAILALLYLTLDGDGRAWKGFDWSAMNRLHEKGFIGDWIGIELDGRHHQTATRRLVWMQQKGNRAAA